MDSIRPTLETLSAMLEKHTPQEIQRIYGVHLKTVNTWMRELGIDQYAKPARYYLTKKEVREIRKKYENCVSMNQLSRDYRVSKRVISDIIHYRSWKHV